MSQASPKPANANRRASRRQPARSSTRVIAYRNSLGLGPNIALSVLDLSETGIRLLLKEALSAGKEFEVNLENCGCPYLKAVAQVVWSVPAADGNFCVGARFNKPIDYRALQAVVRP